MHNHQAIKLMITVTQLLKLNGRYADYQREVNQIADSTTLTFVNSWTTHSDRVII